MDEVIFEHPWVVSDLRITLGDEKEHFNATVVLTNYEMEHILIFNGGRDIEDLTLLFGASRVSVIKNTDKGLEFGLYTLCVTNEGYMEFEFDSFEYQHAT